MGGSSRILVALFCSYTNVGIASLQLRPKAAGGDDSIDQDRPVHGGPSLSSNRATRVNLRWRATSSQQCIVDVGTTGVGAHVLWVSAEEGDRQRGSPASKRTYGEATALVGVEQQQQQVLIYGVYEQQLTSSAV